MAEGAEYLKIPETISSDSDCASLLMHLEALDQLGELTPEQDEFYDRIMLLVLQYDARKRPRRPWLL